MKFCNSIVVNITFEKETLTVNKLDELERIFVKLIHIFHPFYGCFCSNDNKKMFDGGYYDVCSKKPVAIFDLNFWEKECYKQLLADKIKTEVNKCIYMENGYFIRLFKEAIDSTNEQHINYQKMINIKLGL